MILIEEKVLHSITSVGDVEISCVFELIHRKTRVCGHFAFWIPLGCLDFINNNHSSKAARISCGRLEEASLVSYDLLD